MELFELTPPAGAKRERKRIGRGIGSGWGKTSGKGHKGQKSRAGGKVAVGFEGGQMPIYRRLPKRGFKSLNPTCFEVVNLDQLNAFDAGTEITVELLAKVGIVRKATSQVKVLSRGQLDKALLVKASAFSQAAQQAIVAAGGTAEVV